MAIRVRRHVLPLSCALLLASQIGQAQLLPPPPPPPTPVIPPGVLDPLLQERLGTASGRSPVIIGARDAAALANLTALVTQAGGTPGRTLGIVRALAADIPNTSISTLAANPLVRRMALDRLTLSLTERTSATVGATAARQAFGYRGEGIGVAVIDSGITGYHDDLMQDGNPGSQRVDRFVDFVNGHTAPYDDYGHGTHVAGIIAGNGYDSGGARAGLAPASHLMVLKVLDAAGRGRISDVIAAFDYVAQHAPELNVRVVNLSIAAVVSESYQTDFLTTAARGLVERGIVVVAAAGNMGRSSNGRTQYGSITAPANAPWVLTVGASSHGGTTDRGDDTIAPFSSRGPTAIDRVAKPDLVAPGVGTVSLSDPASAMFTTRSQYLLNGTVETSYRPYLSLSGTSQAAPVVGGTVALMLQANPALTPNAVKAILQYTAERRGEYDAMTQGAGFLNALGAVALARFLASPGTVSYPSTAGWSLAVHWGNQRIANGTLGADAVAWATDVVWGARSTAAGGAIRWGMTCSVGLCDGTDASTPIVWENSCSDAQCQTVVWDQGRSINVVWGGSCGGADCDAQPWSPGDESSGGDGYTVRGSSEGETLVWGTSGDEGDTIVWGTSGCTDPSCTPVIWE